jgi:hypothetical protein
VARVQLGCNKILTFFEFVQFGLESLHLLVEFLVFERFLVLLGKYCEIDVWHFLIFAVKLINLSGRICPVLRIAFVPVGKLSCFALLLVGCLVAFLAENAFILFSSVNA